MKVKDPELLRRIKADVMKRLMIMRKVAKYLDRFFKEDTRPLTFNFMKKESEIILCFQIDVERSFL